ncbi:hypothetical protein WK95_16210 [Burkholderia ubonensis]|nr:hypothetical protein WK95_16210 [Burkholderia ubonensis]
MPSMRYRAFSVPLPPAPPAYFVAVRIVMSFRTFAPAVLVLPGPFAGPPGVFQRSTRRAVRAG